MDRKKYKQEWYQKNKERTDAINKAWALANPGAKRSIGIKNRFGITGQEYDDLLKSQEGRCAICEKEMTDNKKTHLDHNHETKKIRGFLCHGCNTGIGHLGDSVEILQKAINYLNKHKGI